MFDISTTRRAINSGRGCGNYECTICYMRLPRSGRMAAKPVTTALRDALPKLAVRDQGFARSMLAQLDRDGTLTPKQMYWVAALVTRVHLAVAPPEPDRDPPEISISLESAGIILEEIVKVYR